MGWQWHQVDYMQIICTSLQTNNHASTSSVNFLHAGCSCFINICNGFTFLVLAYTGCPKKWPLHRLVIMYYYYHLIIM